MLKQFILFCTFGFFSLGAVSADTPNTPIRFAMEATYAPFEYMNEQGEIEGFDIDIAKALCQRIPAECTFSNQPFSSLIPALKVGKFDALISAVSITDERAKQVDFSHSYYSETASYVGPVEHTFNLTPEGLKGMVIGTQAGTSMEQYLRSTYKGNISVKTYASIIEAFLDLKAGRLDLVLADSPIAQSWLDQKSAAGYQIIGKPVDDPTFFGQGFAIAVRKGNFSLLTQINKALASIKSDGTYQKITSKYFSH